MATFLISAPFNGATVDAAWAAAHVRKRSPFAGSAQPSFGSHVDAFHAKAEPRIRDVIYVETPQVAPARQHLTKN